MGAGPFGAGALLPGFDGRTMELARRYDVPVYSHIYELRGMALQARLTLPEYGGSLIKRLADEGVLDPLLNLAHSVWLRRDEIDLLAETRHRRGAQSAGQSENEMRDPSDPRLQDAGVRIGLGCDNCSCSDAQNMFMAMKLFALLAAASDPLPGTAASRRRAAGGDRGRGGRRPPRSRDRPHRARLQGRPHTHRHERPVLVAAEQRGAAACACRSRARRAPCHGRRRGRGSRPPLTTIDEDEIYDAVQVVMPGFRRDFTAISERVQRLQPWLDQAHQRIVSTELDFDRIYIPF